MNTIILPIILFIMEQNKENKEEIKKSNEKEPSIIPWLSSLHSETKFEIDSPFLWKSIGNRHDNKTEIFIIGIDHRNPKDETVIKYLSENKDATIFFEDTFPIMSLSKNTSGIADTAYLIEFLKNNNLYNKKLLRNISTLYPKDIAILGTNLMPTLLNLGDKVLKEFKKVGEKVKTCISDVLEAVLREKELQNISIAISRNTPSFYSQVSSMLTEIFPSFFHKHGFPLETCIANSILNSGLVKSDLMLLQHIDFWNKKVSDNILTWLEQNKDNSGKVIIFLENRFLNPFIPNSVIENLERQGYYFQNHYWNRVMTTVDILKDHVETVLKINDETEELKNTKWKLLVQIISQSWILDKLSRYFDININHGELERIKLIVTLNLIEQTQKMNNTNFIMEIYSFYKNFWRKKHFPEDLKEERNKLLELVKSLSNVEKKIET
jgi:hypothetical protein